MPILLVEDDIRLAPQVRAALESDGHAVVTCGLGEEGVRLALDGGFDLVLLDIQLPDRDGWSVLAELKQRGAAAPVLLLTTQGTSDDRVKGFDLGADDYLPKPFDFREMIGRVRAILRRAGSRVSRVDAGDVVLDLDTRRASRGGKALHLAPNEFRLLLLLARAGGRAVTRSEIAEQILGRKHLGNSNAIEVLVRRLRQKVDDGFDRERIRTVRGVGYSFVPSDEPPAPSTPPPVAA